MLHHFHCDEFFIILNHKLHCCNFWTLPPLLLLNSRKSLAPSAPSHQAAEDCNKILLEPSLLKAEQTQCIADMFNSSGPQVLSCKAAFYPISLQGHCWGYSVPGAMPAFVELHFYPEYQSFPPVWCHLQMCGGMHFVTVFKSLIELTEIINSLIVPWGTPPVLGCKLGFVQLITTLSAWRGSQYYTHFVTHTTKPYLSCQ